MVFYSKKLLNLVKKKVRGIFLRSDKAGETILTRACKKFKLRFVKLLSFLGVSIKAKNKRGETPLWATLNSRNKNKNDDLVKFFVKQKVDLNIGYGGHTPLTFAISKNDVELVKILLEDKNNKADVNLKNSLGKIPLILACEKGNLDIIKLLINQKVDVNCKNKDGETPLWLACKYKNNNLAKLLFDEKADINLKCGKTTLLTFACKKNNYDFAKLLLQNNFVVNYSDNYLWTILNSKIENKITLIDLLLENNVDVNRYCWGETPLTFAVKENNMNLLKSLISSKNNNIDINKTNLYNESALWLAINNGNTDMIRYLIDNGIDINYKNGVKDTPLIYAIKKNDKELFNILFENDKNKVDVDKQNIKSPLWWAIGNKNYDFIETLLKNKANVDKEYGVETPLMVASRNGNMELVKLLILNEYNKANVNYTNIFEENALWKALNAKKYDVLKFLVENNADINKRDICGNTPLFVVSRDGNMELVKFFIQKNADLDLENENEETPLIIACVKNEIDIAIFLINNGADVNKKDVFGRNVLTIACKKNDKRLLQLLVHKKDAMGNTPLIVACEKGNFKLVKLFVQNNAHVNIDIGGKTPLLITLKHIKNNKYNSDCILKHYKKIAKYLIDNGADVNMVVYDKTPLLEAIIYNNEIAKYLIDKGADVNKSVYDKFPLLESIVYNKEIAKYLIDKGADVNVENFKGQTPLELIVDRYGQPSVFTDKKNDIELAKLLIANGARIDVLYTNLEKKERREFIKLLLEDDVIKVIIAIRNKEIADKKLINKEATDLLDKEKVGIVTKTNIEMANIFFRKKKLQCNELKL